MASKFQYGWYTIDIVESSGKMTYEFKAKSKDHAVKQIKTMVAKRDKIDNASLPWWDREPKILEVCWNTLTLDREGYQRRF